MIQIPKTMFVHAGPVTAGSAFADHTAITSTEIPRSTSSVVGTVE
jgi:hypothetical protein